MDALSGPPTAAQTLGIDSRRFVEDAETESRSKRQREELTRSKIRATECSERHHSTKDCMLNYYPQTLCSCATDCCPCPKPAQTRLTDVRDAGDRGTGLFACELIPQQTLIIEYTGNRIGPKEKKELLRQGSVYIFQVGPKEFVDASVPNRLNLARHINHSCSPNAAVEIWDGSAGAARALVISKRNIHPNEEITIHYGSDFIPSPCLCEKCLQPHTATGTSSLIHPTEAQSEPEWELGAETFIQIRKCGYVEGEDIVLSYNFAEQMTGPKIGHSEKEGGRKFLDCSE
ncbi:hypothetical protein B0H13DRAFT_1885426 [Mycena leptocephala]|nr:hypothetical protein B0H13DRAFT_1885426 [Mycena leptocephala]